MRSKRKSNSHRILVVFGNGLVAGFGVDLLYLLGKTGFSLFPVLGESAQNWIGSSTLQNLTCHGIYSHGAPPPPWLRAVASYDLALVFGNPSPGAKGIEPFSAELRAKCGRTLFLVESSPTTPSDIDVRNAPQDPGAYRSWFEDLFAEISAFLHHRSCPSLSRLTFTIADSDPQATEGDRFCFARALTNSLVRCGLTPYEPATAGKPANLAIELFPGPFAPLPTPGTDREPRAPSFAPEFAPPPAPAELGVRFFHHSLSQDCLQAASGEALLAAARFPTGDIVFHTPQETRTIPHFARRPAGDRFAEFLAARLSDQSRSSS